MSRQTLYAEIATLAAGFGTVMAGLAAFCRNVRKSLAGIRICKKPPCVLCRSRREDIRAIVSAWAAGLRYRNMFHESIWRSVHRYKLPVHCRTIGFEEHIFLPHCALQELHRWNRHCNDRVRNDYPFSKYLYNRIGVDAHCRCFCRCCNDGRCPT